MPKRSAGIVLFRRRDGQLQVFLVHPGGPFWVKKDTGAWSIPKGEFEDEEPLIAAVREFQEETGFELTTGDVRALGSVRQSGGKVVHAFAIEGDLDPAALSSNTFTMEWPPRSGHEQAFPEVDRGGWFTLDEARKKLHKGQIALIERLEAIANEI